MKMVKDATCFYPCSPCRMRTHAVQDRHPLLLIFQFLPCKHTFAHAPSRKFVFRTIIMHVKSNEKCGVMHASRHASFILYHRI